MKILITGGNGYVGRELCRQLFERHDVYVLDTLRYGCNRFSGQDLGRIRLFQADITDPAAVADVVSSVRPDALIHLAAIHYIPECENDPALAVRTNVLGTVNALMACPEGTRFVYASSGAVYKPDDHPHSEENAVVLPTDIYGLTKLHGENYVRYLAKIRQLSAVIVRLFNVVGPGETNPHLLPEIVAQLKAGRTSIRLGNLWPKRDYIHVKDAASGFAAAVNGAVRPTETVVVNLGSSQPYSVEEVVKKLRRISGCEFSLWEDPSRVRPVDRPFLAADTSRIQQLFGWRVRYTIDDALADLWREPDLAESLTARYQ
jgi:UDP-glucose 4-epimerase